MAARTFLFLGKAIFCLLLSMPLIRAQSQYTPYDEIEGINAAYKPLYHENYPAWGKMLYQYPVNFNVINNEFERTESEAESKESESPVKRYFLLWRKVISNYADANGKITIPDEEANRKRRYESQLNSQQAQRAGQAGRTQGESRWSFIGPQTTLSNGNPTRTFITTKIQQTNIYTFDIASKDRKIMYAGSETGYVSKSVDEGVTWSLLKDYNFFGSIEAIAIDPVQNNIVYAASGNGQIHKSENSGATWTPMLASPAAIHANRIRINDNPANQLLVAAREGLFVKNGTGPWVNKWSGSTIYDVRIQPDNPTTIFAVGKNSSNKFMVIVSTDSGATFRLMDGFPATIDADSGAVMSMSAENTSVLYVLLLSPNNTPLLYTGTLASHAWTWSLTNTGGENNPNFQMDNGQGYFDLVLEAHATNHRILYAGTTTLYVSRDAGNTFSVLGGYRGRFDTHPDFQWMKSLPKDSVWLSTDGGMSLSIDNFTTAEGFQPKIQGLMGSDFWGFDQGWNEDLIVGGRYHNGNTALADYYLNKSISLGGGESATGWVIHGRERHVAFDDIGALVLPKSTNSVMPKETFTFGKYPNMDGYGGRPSNLVSHPNYFNTIYVGQGNSLWLGTNYGADFSMLYTFPDKVRYFQVSLTHPNIMYLDVIGKGLHKTEDGGITWTPKPSITTSYGDNSWQGNLFFCISPKDPNVIYVNKNFGYPAKIYKSTDGGGTWTDWTGNLPSRTTAKHVMIQPDENGDDLVYVTLTSHSGNATNASVYYRRAAASSWVNFSDNLPIGLGINFAKPFYRDAKIRLGTNCGAWESPMAVAAFKPVIIPWAEAAQWGCADDTLHFEDHSILNHQGAGWNWSITPAPRYIEDANKRNPKVVLGAPGAYSVTLTVTIDNIPYSKTMNNFVTAKTCPSYKDCSDPGLIPKRAWKAVADSQELIGEGPVNGRASAAIDGDFSTFWHTQWHGGSPPYPHYIQIDMGDKYQISTVYLYPRQSSDNGNIRDYAMYLSETSSDYGDPVAVGTFDNSKNKKTVTINKASGRYFTLNCISSQNRQHFASLLEIEIVGCLAPPPASNPPPAGFETAADHKAYPIPVQSELNIEIPFTNLNKIETAHYSIFSTEGRTIQKGDILMENDKCRFDLEHLLPGVYVLRVTNENGQHATIKFIKN